MRVVGRVGDRMTGAPITSRSLVRTGPVKVRTSLRSADFESSTEQRNASSGPPTVGVGWAGSNVNVDAGRVVVGAVVGQAAIGPEEERVLRRLGWPLGQVAPSGAVGARAGHEDAHGAGAARAGGPVGQVLVQPAQSLLARRSHPARADGQMRPVTDRHGHLDTAGPKPVVLVHGLLQEEVLPAADEEDGDLHALERGGVLHRRPEGIGRLGPRHPLGVPGRPPAQDRARRLGQRERVHVRADPAGCRGGAQRPGQAAAVLLVHNAVAPAQEVEPEGAGAPDVLLEVVRPDGHDGRRQFRGRVGHQGPLGVPQVGAADRGEGAGEPGLVAASRPPRRARRPPRSPWAGTRHPSRMCPGCSRRGRCSPRAEDPHLRHGQGQRAAVGSTHQNGPDDVRRRLVQVRCQLDAVAHGDAHVARHRVVRRGGGQAAQTGGRRIQGLGSGRCGSPALPSCRRRSCTCLLVRLHTARRTMTSRCSTASENPAVRR